MYLSELNWDDVPEDVSVVFHTLTRQVQFVKNLREGLDAWLYEGDECNIQGEIFNPDEGWRGHWTLLERPAKQQEVCPIAEWLNKWGVVYNKCPDVGGIDFDNNANLMITTDFGDIYGADGVVDFVNTRYATLKSEEADKRKAELEAKRLKVLQELSDIDQELGRYIP